MKVLALGIYYKISQNVQAHFNSHAANAARFLKYD